MSRIEKGLTSGTVMPWGPVEASSTCHRPALLPYIRREAHSMTPSILPYCWTDDLAGKAVCMQSIPDASNIGHQSLAGTTCGRRQLGHRSCIVLSPVSHHWSMQCIWNTCAQESERHICPTSTCSKHTVQPIAGASSHDTACIAGSKSRACASNSLCWAATWLRRYMC